MTPCSSFLLLLLAPPPVHSPCTCRWYHGPINRIVACLRLEAVGSPGAFLVRESSSESGVFVLSFLDSSSRVHHFKIVRSHLGQFNIGGNVWFSSLAKLVAYHSKYSPVVENVDERLDIPVAPPSVSFLVHLVVLLLMAVSFEFPNNFGWSSF